MLIGTILIAAGMLWYPIGYSVIDSITVKPDWWVDWVLGYKNQECWALIISGVFMLGWSIRV